MLEEINYDYYNKIINSNNLLKEIENKNLLVRVKNFFEDEICKWIILESERYASENKGWKTKRHTDYHTTDLEIKSINSIKVFLNNVVVRDLFPIIEESYNLIPYKLSIIDLFIVKYEFDKQTNLPLHKDGSIISFNISLNSDFEGGGTIIFENSCKRLYKNPKGDVLIHTGKLLHSGNRITSGIRYILVGFIDYMENESL